ncbi:MAG: sensor domain-containing protein [Candidatus Limnocylindrales bacterium]
MMNASGGVPEAAPNPAPTLTLRSFLLSPIDPATWRAGLAILIGLGLLGIGFNGLFIIWSIGGSLLVALVGIPIIGFGIELARWVARAERWRMELVDGRPMVSHRYRPLDLQPRAPYGEWLRQYAEGQFLDFARWRDVVYVLIGFPLAVLWFALMVAIWSIVLGLFAATVALIAGVAFEGGVFEGETIPLVAPVVTGVMCLALIPVAAFITRGLMTVQRAIAQLLLSVDPTEALRQDVERLRESRSAAVELEASELRRIERDLHDGAQQRLVMLAMDLGRAEEKIDSDPEGARQLVSDAREQSRLALAELRDLVRGTAPSILIDRGIVAAVASIAQKSRIPTNIDAARIGEARFSPAVERAGYFVATEALANVAKHSHATRADVIFWRDTTRLFVEVWDNGQGGASLEAGGGLAGLRDRVATIDGSLQVVSPPGGPTMVRATLPIGIAPGS